jgi:hypothetical protein
MSTLMTTPIKTTYITHRGNIRSDNEDSMLIAGIVVAGTTMHEAGLIDITHLPALFCVAAGEGRQILMP